MSQEVQYIGFVVYDQRMQRSFFACALGLLPLAKNIQCSIEPFSLVRLILERGETRYKPVSQQTIALPRPEYKVLQAVYILSELLRQYPFYAQDIEHMLAVYQIFLHIIKETDSQDMERVLPAAFSGVLAHWLSVVAGVTLHEGALHFQSRVCRISDSVAHFWESALSQETLDPFLTCSQQQQDSIQKLIVSSFSLIEPRFWGQEHVQNFFS